MGKQGNRDNCIANSFNVADYARKFAPGHWSFFGPGSGKKWYGTHVHKPNSESGHPVFPGSSAFERGDLKSKGKGRSAIHFNGSDETIEVILRTVISVNQISIYGAVADLCGELAWEISRNSKGTEKPGALENLETILMPPECRQQIKLFRLMQEYRGTCFVNTSRDSQIFQNVPNGPNSAPMLVSRRLEKGQYFMNA